MVGVQFLVGIVLGSFLTWELIDIYLGPSVFMLAMLLASMVACFALCYAMVAIHDSFVDDEEAEEQGI
jgi:hypothetical protein